MPTNNLYIYGPSIRVTVNICGICSWRSKDIIHIIHIALLLIINYLYEYKHIAVNQGLRDIGNRDREQSSSMWVDGLNTIHPVMDMAMHSGFLYTKYTVF